MLTVHVGSFSPYYGQAGWFILFSPEKIPSVIERYQKEIIRVLGVLESVLSKQQWLVGGKCSVADLSFITYVAIFAFEVLVSNGRSLDGTTSLPPGS